MRRFRAAVLFSALLWLLLGFSVGKCLASGRQVFLEDEQDLGNGYKLCIYSEGVTITRRDYQLCPLSIEV
jgi:hypothetical protein